MEENKEETVETLEEENVVESQPEPVEPTEPVEPAEPVEPVAPPVEEPAVEAQPEPVAEPQAEAVSSEPESKTETMEPIIEPEKKKGVPVPLIIVGVVALLAIAGYLLLPNLVSKKTIVSQEFTTLFNGARKVLDKAEKNTLKYDLEKDSVGLSGNITFDSDYKDKDIDLTKLKDYIISYEGVIDKKGNQASAGLKFKGNKEILNVQAMIKGKDAYFNLGDLYSKTITSKSETEVKDLEVSSITTADFKLLLDKTEKVFKDNIKEENITKEKVEKEIDGKKGSYQKVAYKISEKDYMTKLLEAYKSDDSVVDVLARMSNSSEKEVKDLLDKSLKSLKDSEDSTFMLNLYTEGLRAKTKEIELVEGDSSIVIDVVNGDERKYKVIEDGKETITGTYNLQKQEFTMKMEEDETKVDFSLKSESDHKVTGELTAKSEDMDFKAGFELDNKISGKKAYTDFSAKINYVEGAVKLNFTVHADNSITVGAKVNEISTGNTIDYEKVSEQDMNNIYMKLMQKLQPVINEIMPGASSADFRKALS